MDGRKAALFVGGAILLTLGVVLLYNKGVEGTDKKAIGSGFASFLKKLAPISSTEKRG